MECLMLRKGTEKYIFTKRDSLIYTKTKLFHVIMIIKIFMIKLKKDQTPITN